MKKSKCAKKIICLLLSAAAICACGCTPGTSPVPVAPENGTVYKTISVDEYTDKTTSGLLAQFVGFLSGYEFALNSDGSPRSAMPDEWFEMCNGPYAEYNSRNKREDKLIYNEQSGIWEVWNDDDYSIDILNQYIIRDMYEEEKTLSSKVITDGWLRYDVYDMGGGHRSNGAYGLMKKFGYVSPFTGSGEYGNLYSYCGEPYIENETLGMNAAGMPDTAYDMAGMFAGVTSDTDSGDWAKVFAAMYSMAYFETDIEKIIRAAVSLTPEGSIQREITDTVFALRGKYPDDWRRAVVNAERLCYRDHYGATSKMGETGINCSFILIGLLYGEGDYYNTCKIISLAGHGGDSTTPVGLGIVGVICGMDGLPAVVNEKIWQNGKGTVVNLPTGTNSAYYMYAANLPERILMADIVEMYRNNFEKILFENGGKIENGYYYIPDTELKTPESAAIPNGDFEEGKLDGYETAGNVSLTQTSYTGKYAGQINGGSGNGKIGLTVGGLTAGNTYRLTAFVFTSARSEAKLYALDPVSGTLQTASVYDTSDYVKRQLVFMALSDTAEIGMMFENESEYKYAAIDEIVFERVAERKAGSAVAEGGSGAVRSGTLNVSVRTDETKQVYLKIGFANTSGKITDVRISLNGSYYETVPFYKTGTQISKGMNDAVYIPIVPGSGDNTVSLDLGGSGESDSGIYIRSAEIVTVTDRW